MLIYFHGGDVFDELVIFALIIIGFIVIFSIPLIFIIRDWREALKEREQDKQ